jgi:hypothetical protein
MKELVNYWLTFILIGPIGGPTNFLNVDGKIFSPIIFFDEFLELGKL